MNAKHLRNYLKEMTPEQRLEMRQKAAQTRLDKQAYAEANLKLEYADMSHWEGLAKEAGVRLPHHNTPNTDTKYIKRIAKKIGVDINQWLVEGVGATSLADLNNLNPTYTARAMSGLLLEWAADSQPQTA